MNEFFFLYFTRPFFSKILHCKQKKLVNELCAERGAINESILMRKLLFKWPIANTFEELLFSNNSYAIILNLVIDTETNLGTFLKYLSMCVHAPFLTLPTFCYQPLYPFILFRFCSNYYHIFFSILYRLEFQIHLNFRGFRK